MEREEGARPYRGDNRRIARNTLSLYFRYMLTLFVSLYTSRVVLGTLGVDDYGVYNVVGGFVSMFNVISGAFSIAISRFMSFEHGTGDLSRMRACYSAALAIQALVGAGVCILLATVGYWYVSRVMVLPEGREGTALWVLLFSSASFYVEILATPYNAMIVAHEHMRAFARIGIAEAALKLLAALLIRIAPSDALVFYSALMALSLLLTRLLYVLYCKRHFEECKFSMHFDRGLLRDMASFISWAFLGNGAVVLKDQGVTMILNIFGGTRANAARGIAQSVGSAVQSFTNNFLQAFQPQVTQLYSSGDVASMRRLVCRSSRFAFCLMLLPCLPLLKNIEYVIEIWLGQVPDYVVEFAIVTLLEAMTQALRQPLLYGVLATGRIRTYEIALSITYASSLPLTYAALGAGLPLISAYVIVLCLEIAVFFILVWQSGRTYGLSIREYVGSVFVRIACVAAASGGAAYVASVHTGYPFLDFVAESAVSVCVTAAAAFLLGMNHGERVALVAFAKGKMRLMHRRHGN